MIQYWIELVLALCQQKNINNWITTQLIIRQAINELHFVERYEGKVLG